MRKLTLVGFILVGCTVSTIANEQIRAQALGAVITYVGLAGQCGDQFPDRDLLADAQADAPVTLEAGGYAVDEIDAAVTEAEAAAAALAKIEPAVCKTLIESIETGRDSLHQRLKDGR